MRTRRTLQSSSNSQGKKKNIRGKIKEYLLWPVIFTVRKMIRSRAATFGLKMRRVVRYLRLFLLFLQSIKLRKVMSIIFIKTMTGKLSSQIFSSVRLMLVKKFIRISINQVQIPKLFKRSTVGQESRGNIQLVKARVILLVSSRESKKLPELQHAFRQSHSIKSQLLMSLDQEVRWITSVAQVSATLTKIS